MWGNLLHLGVNAVYHGCLQKMKNFRISTMSSLVDFTKHRSSRRVKFVTFLVSLISQGGAGTKKLVETRGKKRGKSIILERTDFFKGYFVFSAAGI